MAKSTKPQTTTTTTRTTRASKPRTSLATDAPAFTQEDIAMRAYELFLREGASHGRDLEHWLRAEHELRERVELGR